MSGSHRPQAIGAVADAVGRYAARMHASTGSGHHVASPFGAWVLLALAASAAAETGSDDLTAVLDEALGMPVADAHTAALDLLAQPHPALQLAAAAWRAPELSAGAPAVEHWLRTLGAAVETGEMPSQAQADAWASEHTNGLIEQFPLQIDAHTALVVASAVACAISWQVPFEVAAATEAVLPRAAGFDTVEQLLHTPPRAAREQIVDTSDGLVAVHAMPSTDGDMLVVSVIADPAVPPPDVLTHAHRIAIALARSEDVPGQRSLFDLPLGAAHSWTLSEDERRGHRDEERFDSLVAAWSAHWEYDLMPMRALAFGAAGTALRRLLPDPDRLRSEARQVAMARYTRTGFEAAAVTAMGVRAAAMLEPRRVRVRTAQLEFTHPYGVVAVAVADTHSAWAGLPLFSAWVAEADPVD